jgi:hypothetical protein
MKKFFVILNFSFLLILSFYFTAFAEVVSHIFEKFGTGEAKAQYVNLAPYIHRMRNN